MQGFVVFFDQTRKYGFVANEAGQWFFHARQTIGEVQKGDVVEFWLNDSPVREGLEAVEVRRLDRG